MLEFPIDLPMVPMSELPIDLPMLRPFVLPVRKLGDVVVGEEEGHGVVGESVGGVVGDETELNASDET